MRIQDGRAMSELRSMGCTVSYYNGWDDEDSTWLEKRLDDCFGRRARSVRWRGARIQDLSPLQKIADLREVFIFDSHIDDISPLSQIGTIRHLHLTGSNIEDLTPLHSLTNLKELNVYRTPISNVEVDRFAAANPNCNILHPSTESNEMPPQ